MRERRGHEHIHQRGDDEVEDLVVRRDAPAIPQQQRRHVPDGRPRAPSITGDDAEAGVLHAIGTVGHKAAQHGDDDDSGSEVIQEGGEEEGGEGHTPQEAALIGRLDDLRHRFEAPVVIDRIDQHHGAEDEEERPRDIAEVLGELEGEVVRDIVRCLLGRRVTQEVREALRGGGDVGIDQQDEPEQHAGQQRRGGLVHLDLLLEGNPKDAEDEDQGHEVIGRHWMIELG